MLTLVELPWAQGGAVRSRRDGATEGPVRDDVRASEILPGDRGEGGKVGGRRTALMMTAEERQAFSLRTPANRPVKRRREGQRKRGLTCSDSQGVADVRGLRIRRPEGRFL